MNGRLGHVDPVVLISHGTPDPFRIHDEALQAGQVGHPVFEDEVGLANLPGRSDPLQIALEGIAQFRQSGVLFGRRLTLSRE